MPEDIKITVDDGAGGRISPYVGANPDPELNKPVEGDRGDDLVPLDNKAPAAPEQPPPPEPEVPENPINKETKDEVDPDDRPRDENGRFIPHSRFNEVNEKRKAAEKLAAEQAAEIEALRKQIMAPKPAENEPEPEPKYDFDKAEEEYIDLVLDGKKDEALAKRREIREQEQVVIDVRSSESFTKQTTQEKLQTAIADVADGYVQRFAQLNPDSDSFSEELMEDVRIVYAGVLQNGKYKDPVQAWDQSIRKALKLHGLDPEQTDSKPDDKPARTAADRMAATSATPPTPTASAGGRPNAPAKIDVFALSLDDIAKLPPETLARLRGDTL